MGYVTPEQITKAKELDLLTYLQRYDPHELVHVSGSTYCTREHDSLKISNGKWNWFSRGIGGKTALDYLIRRRLKIGNMPSGKEFFRRARRFGAEILCVFQGKASQLGGKRPAD